MWQPPRESEYTAPTAHCPHPEWWTTENSYATECEVSMLIAALVKAAQPEFVVEIGTHYGQTTERIANVMAENGHGRFVSLEIDHGLYESGMNRCSEQVRRCLVDILNMSSREYIPPAPIDFLFVDGADDRMNDVIHFKPYLAPRALVCVHDMANDWYSQQVPEILEVLGGTAIMLDSPRGLLIVKLGDIANVP